jgi:hypothetical protein
MSIEKGEMAPPPWLSKPLPEQPDPINPRRVRETRFQKHAAAIKGFPRLEESDLEKETKAYLLLSCLQGVGSEQVDIWPILQSPDGEYGNLRCLLAAAVYSRPTSLIARAAFKILKILFYGSPPEQLNVRPLWGNEAVCAIVEEFARQLEFRANPTPQMVAAMPIFGRVRYSALKSELPEKMVFGVYPDATAVDGAQPFEPPELKGMTPIELFAPRLFDEPPLSDALGLEIMELLDWHVAETKGLRAGKGDHVELQKEVIRKDLPVFNLLRVLERHFGDREWLMRVTALAGADPSFAQERRTWRIAVNGFAVSFGTFLRASSVFCLADGESAGDMAEKAAEIGVSARNLAKLQRDPRERVAEKTRPASKADAKRQSKQMIESCIKYESPE